MGSVSSGLDEKNCGHAGYRWVHIKGDLKRRCQLARKCAGISICRLNLVALFKIYILFYKGGNLFFPVNLSFSVGSHAGFLFAGEVGR